MPSPETTDPYVAANKASVDAFEAEHGTSRTTEHDDLELRVAKAICAAMGDTWNREGRGNVLLAAYGPLARAAIKAMEGNTRCDANKHRAPRSTSATCAAGAATTPGT